MHPLNGTTDSPFCLQLSSESLLERGWKPLLIISLTWSNMRVWRPGNHLSRRCLPVLHIRFDCVVITFIATSAAILHKCDLICVWVASWGKYTFCVSFFFFWSALHFSLAVWGIYNVGISHIPQLLKCLLFFWCISSGISGPRWPSGGICEHNHPAQLAH